MNATELKAQIIAKYGACYWDEIYATMEDLEIDLQDEPNIEICREPWEDFGVTLVELTDGNMWCSIVVINEQLAKNKNETI